MIHSAFPVQLYKRNKKIMTFISLCIDGNIAAGKSTLLAALRQRLGSQKHFWFLHEPVERFCQYKKEFNPLQLAYQHPKVYSCITQLHILREIKEFYSENLSSDGRLYVTDRCPSSTPPFINALYRQNYISEFETLFLRDEAASGSQKFPVKKHLFISCPPKSCFERVHARKREEESTVSLHYLEILDQTYQEYINDLISEKGACCIKVLPFDDPLLVDRACNFLLGD
jgi:deoxyadenosine/deoxycytidine kinase